MTARNDTISLQHRLVNAGIPATFDDANELRRAQLTLHRWSELECGDGDDYKSWSIEREEVFRTGDGRTFKTQNEATAYVGRVAERTGKILAVELAEGAPYMCVYPHKGESRRYRIADRELGALRRVFSLCKRLGIDFFYQTDPRGCALYVSREVLTDQNYTRGIACCV